VEKLLYALMAQEAGGGQGGGEQAAGGCQQMLPMLFPILLMFVIIYFLIIRPQQKQQRQHKEMLSALKKGDKVITNGGIFGVIVNMSDTVATLEVAKNTHIRILRAQLAGLQPGALEKAAEEAGAPEGK